MNTSQQNTLRDLTTSKYVISFIDGQTYCRKNGQFLRHLKHHNHSYESYYNKYIGPSSVVSYSDNRWGTGALYSKLGFTYSHTSKPNYKYFKTNTPHELFSRQQFQKHKLRLKFDVFDENMTEYQNMLNNGYDRIWDCGKDVYHWRCP